MKFAQNCKIPFITSENFFFNHDKNLKGPYYDIKDTKEQSIIMLVGSPASGKTTFCKKYLPEYFHFNNDTLLSERNTKLSEKKKMGLLDNKLKEGLNIVLDNTNRNIIVRERYINIIKKHLYFLINTGTGKCSILNKEIKKYHLA